MEILHTTIKAGATEPFRVIHASDTHLTLADLRDGVRKVRLAGKRQKHFPDAEQTLDAIVQLHKQTGDVVIHTGDLIDFVSQKNLEAAGQFTQTVDCFMAAGNHEFSLYVGEAKEDAAYREQSLAAVQASFCNDIRFSSRVMHGVNFVAVDNSYYLFEQAQLDALQREVERGLPVVLCVHTPLYAPELYDFLLDKEGRDTPAYLMAVPQEKMAHYTPERYEQQNADAVTKAAYDYILHEDRICAVLAGHVHCPFAFALGSKMQYGVGCTDVRVIDFE